MRLVYQEDKYIEIAQWLAFQCENDTEALNWLDKALYINPSSAVALMVKGDIYQKLEQLDEALHMYNRVLEVDPNSCDAFAEKAQCLAMLGNYESSLEMAENGLSNLPENIDGTHQDYYDEIIQTLIEAKARSLFELGRKEEAIALLKESIERFPESEILSDPLEYMTSEEN